MAPGRLHRMRPRMAVYLQTFHAQRQIECAIVVPTRRQTRYLQTRVQPPRTQLPTRLVFLPARNNLPERLAFSHPHLLDATEALPELQPPRCQLRIKLLPRTARLQPLPKPFEIQLLWLLRRGFSSDQP